MNRRTATQGFTLVELLMVAAIMIVLAGMTVPNLFASKVRANENAALAAIRGVITCQFQVRTQAMIDLDADGTGEYAFLGELSGLRPMRGSSAVLSRPLLTPSLGVDFTGTARRGGYLFQVFLPNSSGVGLLETAGNLANVDPSLAKDYWVVMAWPLNYARTGKRTYFSCQRGDILYTDTSQYDGAGSGPAASAAFVGAAPGRIDSNNLAINQVGSDGHTWRAVQ